MRVGWYSLAHSPQNITKKGFKIPQDLAFQGHAANLLSDQNGKNGRTTEKMSAQHSLLHTSI